MPVDIPLVPSVPWYDLEVPIADADGTVETFVFEVQWNFRDSSWYFQLRQDDGVILVSSVRIVLGTYLGSRSRAKFFRRGVLVAIDTANPPGRTVEAGFDDIGTRVVLRRFSVYEVMNGRGLTK